MRSTVLVAAALATLLLSVPATAGQEAAQYADAVAVFFAMDQDAPEVRQNAVVRFFRPVRVADKILMGKYIIEHDTDRMGRGEPCTHVYDFYTKELVVTFHCTHLNRPRTSTATVYIDSRTDVAILTDFQFAGETASHGVPAR
jgi:hypothetical protein